MTKLLRFLGATSALSKASDLDLGEARERAAAGTGTRHKASPMSAALALEPRFMFDAAGAATGADAAQDAAAEAEAADGAGGGSGDAAGDDVAEAVAGHAPPAERKEIVIADRGVAGIETLVKGMDPNVEVIYLDSGATFEDLAAALEGRQGIDAIHLLSHGSTGSVILSGETLTLDTLDENADALRALGRVMSTDGDLLLYGCKIGADGIGEAFLAQLSDLTGADIAASTNDTGAADLGGDWVLEHTEGVVETGVAVSATAQRDFAAVLATFTFSTATDNNPTITETVSGVTLTISVAGSDSLQILGAGTTGAASGNFVVASNASQGAITASFSSAVDLTSIVFGDQGLAGSFNWVFTPTGGSNPTVTSANDTVNASTHTRTITLNWTGVTSFTVTRSDASAQTTSVFDTFIFTAANSAPALGGTPADDAATEDVATAIDLSAYNVSDADGDTITLTLAVDRGTIASTDGNGVTAGVTVANSGTASMTLQGTAANLNTYLNDTTKITYTTASNDTTTAVLTVTPNDGTTNGTADTVNITITPVNDNPTVAGLPTDVTVTEDTQSNVALGAASFADVDGDTLTVTLTASAGTWATPADGAAVGGGVTETLVSSTVITLVGAAADINTYLDTATNLQYTPPANISGQDQATITVTANDGAGSGNVALGSVNIDVTAVNDVPVFTGLDGTPTFLEGATSGSILDANVTVADVELGSLNGGNGNFAGATLTLVRNGGANAVDSFSIVTGGNLTVAGSNISAGGNVIASFDTASVAGQVTLSFQNNGTIPTTALVNEVMQAIRYSNTSNDPAATVQINWTFSDGNAGNAQGTGDNPGTGTGSTTVTVTNVSDAPTLTATGGNPTFSEGGGAQDLFNTVSASTVEAADRISAMTMAVTNVSDGASEILSFDGSDVALNNGNSVNTATNGLTVNVSVTGSTATVSFTGATLTAAQFQTLIDGLTYRNTSEAPTTAGNRVVTVTGITDTGTTANSGANSATPNITSTVTVTAVNDQPTLANFGPNAGNVGFQVGSTTFVAFDSGTAALAADAELDALNSGNGNYNGATITLVRNGGANVNDRFGIAGGTTALDNGSTVTVGATNIGTVTAGSAAAGTITITLNASATSALVDTFFQQIGYISTDAGATGTATFDVTLNDGNSGSQGSGGAQAVTAQATVGFSNVPAISINNAALAYTENAAATQLDAAATLSDPDGDSDWNGGTLTVQITGNPEAGDEISIPDNVVGNINTNGTNILNNATVIGTLSAAEGTVTNNTTLTITFNGNATNALVQQVLQAISYRSTSDAPGTSDRTVTVTATDRNGVNANDTRTIQVTATNDAPAFTGVDNNPTFTEDGAAVVLDNNMTIADAELDALNAGNGNYNGATLQISRQGGANAEDVFSNSGTLAALTQGGNLTVGATNIGTVTTNSGGTLLLTFNASATTALVNSAMQQIAYSNTSDTPAANQTLAFVFNDGNGGADNNDTITVAITASNDVGSLGGVDNAVTFNPQGGAAVVLDGNMSFVDPELAAANGGNGDFNGASVVIVRQGGANAADTFTVQDGANTTVAGGNVSSGGNVIATLNTGVAGQLTITFTNANGTTPTTALVNEVLRNVTYATTAATPDSPITINVTPNDGTAAGTTQTLTATLFVPAADDDDNTFVPPPTPPTGGGGGNTAPPPPPPGGDFGGPGLGAGGVGGEQPGTGGNAGGNAGAGGAPDAGTPVTGGLTGGGSGTGGSGPTSPTGDSADSAVRGQLGSTSDIENTGTPTIVAARQSGGGGQVQFGGGADGGDDGAGPGGGFGGGGFGGGGVGGGGLAGSGGGLLGVGGLTSGGGFAGGAFGGQPGTGVGDGQQGQQPGLGDEDLEGEGGDQDAFLDGGFFEDLMFAALEGGDVDQLATVLDEYEAPAA